MQNVCTFSDNTCKVKVLCYFKGEGNGWCGYNLGIIKINEAPKIIEAFSTWEPVQSPGEKNKKQQLLSASVPQLRTLLCY